MISDKLLAVFLSHASKWIELASEIALKLAAGFDDLVHNLNTLFITEARAEWEVGKVTTNTDASALNHFGFVLWESWAIESIDSHFRLVLVTGAVAMVVLNYSVEEFVELSVGAVRTSVYTHT